MQVQSETFCVEREFLKLNRIFRFKFRNVIFNIFYSQLFSGSNNFVLWMNFTHFVVAGHEFFHTLSKPEMCYPDIIFFFTFHDTFDSSTNSNPISRNACHIQLHFKSFRHYRREIRILNNFFHSMLFKIHGFQEARTRGKLK